MAVVYRARDRELDREVAVKVIRDPFAGESARTRMVDEARVISRLEHRQTLHFTDDDHFTWTVELKGDAGWKRIIEATWVRERSTKSKEP